MNPNNDGCDPITPQSNKCPTTSSLRKRKIQSDSLQSPVIKKVLTETIPPSAVLLALPNVLSVPPNHKSSIASYGVSLSAMRKCLSLSGLPSDIECRTWTTFAELGLRVIKAGWSEDEQLRWASTLPTEVSCQSEINIYDY